MSIARGTFVDDDGSGLTGSIINNAWQTARYDEIDARWFEYTITSTGNQDNLSITSGSREADVLRCNNASLLTIRGIAAPASPVKPGKKLLIVSVGAGQVNLLTQDTNSTAGNRIFTGLTTAGTIVPLSPNTGSALVEYDSVTLRWRLIAHSQGAPLTPTYADSLFTGDGTDGNWVVDAGNVTTNKYSLDVSRKRLYIALTVITTDVLNTPAELRYTIPGGLVSANTVSTSCFYSDSGTNGMGRVFINAGESVIRVMKPTGTWTNATNNTSIQFVFDFEVQ